MSSGNIVITGGNGFVGRHLVDEINNNDTAGRVVVWDREINDLPEGVAGIEVDITKPESYVDNLREVKPAWIVHLAALPTAVLVEQDKDYGRQVNVEAVRHLLENIEELSPKTKVLVASSADIYGSTKLTTGGQGGATPLPELSLIESKPRNPYAQSKWDMEKLIERSFNERCIRVRPFPHIGPGQRRGFVTADFASQIAEIESSFAKASISAKARPVIKVGNLQAKRDFTDVRDVVRAYRLLMGRGELGEVYNIASGVPVAIQEILDTLLEMSEIDIKVERDPSRMRPSDTPVLFGDAAKLKAATAGQEGTGGWHPTISLKSSLSDILNWWRAQT